MSKYETDVNIMEEYKKILETFKFIEEKIGKSWNEDSKRLVWTKLAKVIIEKINKLKIHYTSV